MRHRIDLPETLGTRFSVRAASEQGVGRRRQEARDLSRPFHGVRTTAEPESFRATALAYAQRLRSGQGYGGRTAARLWGLPYPEKWSSSEALIVVVDSRTTPPHTHGVEGRRISRARIQPWRVGAMPVVDPVAAIFMCARDLTVADAVVMIDAVLTTASNYPNLLKTRPRISREDITRRLEDWGRFPGRGTIRAALDRARERVESPKETMTRLALVGAGVPEPAVQVEVFDAGRFVARVDLAYPELKIAIEYEGDGHRTSKAQWRADIARQRRLEALGWIVIRITELDLRDGAGALIEAVTAARTARA